MAGRDKMGRGGVGIHDRHIAADAGIRPFRMNLNYATEAAFLAAKGAVGLSSSAEEGDWFFDTTTNSVKAHNGTQWEEIASASSITGDVTVSAAGAATVTDLTIASEARGDILRRGASAWERHAAKTSGQILVGDGTDIVSVAVSGDATLAANGALTVADSVLEGSNVANTADANVIGGIEVMHRVNTAGGATADTDVTLTHKTLITDVYVQNNAAGTASDTITVKNGSNAITDAIDISGADKTIARVSTIDDAYSTIAAAGTLKITETDGGGSDSPATTVYVRGLRVA